MDAFANYYHIAVLLFLISPAKSIEPTQCDQECVGSPLFLTPMIDRGEIAEARRASSVQDERFQTTPSHSGYLTVNATTNSHLFFWYFKAALEPENAPVVLWLQGGPGVSSMFAVFYEHGPYGISEEREIVARNFSWHDKHHMIYIDNPVGTGFSITDEEGCATDQTAIGRDLYTALVQFFKLFPELQAREFYATGESYAGKYVPALCHTIHVNNPTAALKINLRGFAIGNGFCDPPHMMHLSDYLQQIGLLDDAAFNRMRQHENATLDLIARRDWLKASTTFYNNFDDDMHSIGYRYAYNYLLLESPVDEGIYEQILNSNTIKRALHVGSSTEFSHVNMPVSLRLRGDVMKSVAEWIGELLSHYRGIFYSGQLDIIVAYPLTVNFLKHLDFDSAEEYKTAKRHLWSVDGEIAGYTKTAGNLTEVLVRNAGHSVPMDQPKWAYDIITKLTENKQFAKSYFNFENRKWEN